MRIEAIRLKNFRAFREVELRDLPSFGVFIGANGTGKSTLLSVFQFLHDAMSSNVTAALGKLGGSRGFQEVRSRGATGPIEIQLEVRAELGAGAPDLIIYDLHLDEDDGRPFITQEQLTVERGRGGDETQIPFHFIRDRHETLTFTSDAEEAPPETETLKSPDVLALKALSQFQRFPAAAKLGTLIETWHLSDLRIGRARAEQEAGNAEQLSREGENLSLVLEHLQKRHPKVFAEILQRLIRRIPSLERVDSKITEEGRVLLRFKDGAFEDPFLARHVSDGTIKMLAYLVLLLDPRPHPLLCVEEPEHHLYPTLLSDLAEELRAYSVRGGQVLVTTHSPDFLNAAELDEVFWLTKRDGFTEIRRARDDAQLRAYVEDGDQLGYLWKQGLFENAHP